MENRTLLTNHARVLLAIAGDPGIRLRDIAATLGITERSAHAIVNDLAGAGYVVKHKDGCDGDACPARHAHGRLPPGMAATPSRPTCRRRP